MYYSDFPDSSVGKESDCNAGDPGSIPGWGRYAGEGIGYPLQYSWASRERGWLQSTFQGWINGDRKRLISKFYKLVPTELESGFRLPDFKPSHLSESLIACHGLCPYFGVVIEIQQWIS